MGGSISSRNSAIKILSIRSAVPSSLIILKVHTLCAHTLAPTVLPRMAALIESLLHHGSQASCCTASHVKCHKTLTQTSHLWSTEEPKITRCKVWWIWWFWHECDLYSCQELLHCLNCLCWSIWDTHFIQNLSDGYLLIGTHQSLWNSFSIHSSRSPTARLIFQEFLPTFEIAVPVTHSHFFEEHNHHKQFASPALSVQRSSLSCTWTVC